MEPEITEDIQHIAITFGYNEMILLWCAVFEYDYSPVICLLQELLQPLKFTHFQVCFIGVLVTNECATVARRRGRFIGGKSLSHEHKKLD